MISIIIPVHKSHDYLYECINSIPDENWIEVLVVINSVGNVPIPSVDNRANVRILHSDPQRGAGAARNIGIKKANGIWLLFLDSDDTIYSQSLRKLSRILTLDADVYMLNIESVKAERVAAYRECIVDFDNKRIESVEMLMFWTPPWGKLIRKELIVDNNIYFEEVRYSNDVMFSTKLALLCPRVEVFQDVVYCIRVHSDSLTANVGIDSYRIRLEEELKRYDLIACSNNPELKPRLVTWLLRSIPYGLLELILTYKKIGFNRLDFFRSCSYYLKRWLLTENRKY